MSVFISWERRRKEEFRIYCKVWNKNTRNDLGFIYQESTKWLKK